MKLTTSSFLFLFLLFPLSSSGRTISSVIRTQDADEVSVRESIRKYISDLEDSKTIKLDKQKIIGNPVLTNLYKNEDYQPVWDNASNRKDLIEILDGSYFEGLNPEDYHINFIKDHEEILAGGVRLTLDDYAIADIIMSNAILTYAFHMIQGKVHPTSLDPNWNYSMRPMPDSVEFRLMHRLQTQSLKGGVANIRSELPMYHELRKWFARLDIIRVNMERCRWINNDLPREFLLVNIADYHLYIFRDRQVDYECRVVVGKEFHETPVFTSDIKYVVFNPTWTVPFSIASKEILPKLKKDPNYLQNRNMTLLRGQEEVNPSTVDFSQYSQNRFPFTIRQEPGPNNALGLVKFIFPNKYAVYLHDTPSKSYFEKSDRAFSHGCVRVKDPLILAEQLLGDKGYDSEKIASVIKSKKLQNVYLSKPMPVMLMYWTCYENDLDGRIYFYKDVYGRDKKILSELNKSR
jgi:murein L,D-transpeptidase YcbB/YkuD